jgi:hypothetical protein
MGGTIGHVPTPALTAQDGRPAMSPPAQFGITGCAGTERFFLSSGDCRMSFLH